MILVDIHAAKHLLPRLIERALAGECVVIAQADKPSVRLIRQVTPIRRLGFMLGEMRVPTDFDQMGRDEIEAVFGVATYPGPIRKI